MPRLGTDLLEPFPAVSSNTCQKLIENKLEKAAAHPLCWGGHLAGPKSPKRFASPDLPHPSILMLMSLTTAHLAPFLLNPKHGKIPEVTSVLKK